MRHLSPPPEAPGSDTDGRPPVVAATASQFRSETGKGTISDS